MAKGGFRGGMPMGGMNQMQMMITNRSKLISYIEL